MEQRQDTHKSGTKIIGNEPESLFFTQNCFHHKVKRKVEKSP